MKFSLLMSVYKNDDAKHFKVALKSVCDNSILPNELVLVCDGPLTKKLDKVIDSYKEQLPIMVYRINENIGLGQALRYGLKQCQYDLVARFDADDICTKDRFKKQISFFIDNPYIDVLGSQIIEFEDYPNKGNVIYREVPLEHSNIYNYAKSRNPMNHMTVMFSKSAVLEAGSYQHAPLYEDYDLWIRMLIKGYKFANLADALVYARAGDNMYERRGGLLYAKQEALMQMKFNRLGFLSKYDLIKNLVIRLPVRIIPNSLRRFIYKRLLR